MDIEVSGLLHFDLNLRMNCSVMVYNFYLIPDFDCQYTQNEGELLSSLYFYMYDYNHNLIDTSKLYTSADAVNPNPSPQNGMIFEYTYQGFVDDTDYYIKAVATTVNNTILEIESRLHINYEYDAGYFNIKATNFANGGYVEVVNNITEIDGEVTNANGETTTPKYLADNYIILENDDLHYDSGYQIPSNSFAKQKWWMPVLFGETTRFYNNTGQYLTVEFKRGVKQGECYDYMNRNVELLAGTVGKVIVGKDDTVLRLIAALLCEGHVLLEDVP